MRKITKLSKKEMTKRIEQFANALKFYRECSDSVEEARGLVPSSGDENFDHLIQKALESKACMWDDYIELSNYCRGWLKRAKKER